jgi:hypothetical protein
MPLLIELQYLGSVEYYAMLLAHSEVILEQHENYSKRSYRNRCHILGTNGVLKLSVPLEKGKNQQQSIRKTTIAYTDSWHRQHWRSITSAYGNAPFFEFYKDALETIFMSEPKHLFDFNLKLTETVIRLLELDIDIHLSESYQENPDEGIVDGRNLFSPTKQQALEHIEAIRYPQVFEDKYGFIPQLSILDLMFCQGPSSYQVLEAMFLIRN